MKKRSGMKISQFLLMVGLIMIALGIIFMMLGRKQAARDTVSATAEVTEYVEDLANEGRMLVTVYYPVVTYEVDGQTVTSQYSEHFDDRPYTIGQTLDIKYDPDNPEEFIIAGDDVDTGSKGAFAIVLGAVMFVVGSVWTSVEKIKAGRRR